MHFQHGEVNVLSDHDDIVPSIQPPPPTLASATFSQTPCTKAANQPSCEEQVNKNINKRKRKLLVGDKAITTAIINFSNGVLEIEKMKL